MRYSKGIMWLDDCRIPFVDADKESINFERPRLREKKEWVYELGTTWENPDVKEYNQQGRFTPNLLVCDDMLNDGIEHKSGKVKPHHKRNKTMGEYQGNAYGKFNNISPDLNYDAYYGDKGSNSRYYDLDLWFDKMLERL
jgi:hypothetical protein